MRPITKRKLGIAYLFVFSWFATAFGAHQIDAIEMVSRETFLSIAFELPLSLVVAKCAHHRTDDTAVTALLSLW